MSAHVANAAPKQVVRTFIGEIARRDAKRQMVWGYLATTNRATDGFVLSQPAIEEAFGVWWKWGNIREMHQPQAVGVAMEDQRIDEKGAYAGVHVVDPVAWLKVDKGVYKAFSVRFIILEVDPFDKTLVTKFRVIEASLVDIPADDECVFDEIERAGGAIDVWRFASSEEPDMSKPATQPTAATATQVSAPAAPAEAVAAGGEKPEGAGDDGKGDDPPVEADPAAPVTEPAADPPADPAPAAASAEADPLSEAARAAHASAMAAVERLEQSRLPEGESLVRVAGLPEQHVCRSLWTVRELSHVLQQLAWIINDTAWEAAIEGEDSAVPEKLRAGLKLIGEGFKQLSAQEVEQLLASAGVSRAADVAIAHLSIAAEGEALTDADKASMQRVLDQFSKRGFELLLPAPAAPPETPEDVKRVMADNERLTGEVKTLSDGFAEVTRRLEAVLASPAPAKGAASAHVQPVEKGPDSAGAPSTPAHSAEDVQRAFDALPPAERAVILMRAAHQAPRATIPRPAA